MHKWVAPFASMPKWLKALAVAPITLLAICLVVLIGTRWSLPTRAQRVSLAVLDQPTPPVAGRDGSDFLWTWTYVMPESERADAANRVRRHFNEADVLVGQDRTAEANRLVNPLARYASLSATNHDPYLCGDFDQTCLATVRAHLAESEASLAAHRQGLDVVLRMTDFDGLRWGLKPSFSQVLPQFGNQRQLVRTYYAAMFENGRQQQAFAGLCTHLAAWRRLGGNDDILVGNMVGESNVRQDLWLLGDMTAEQAQDFRLPPECGPALQPIGRHELDICLSMRNEFRTFRSQAMEARQPHAKTWLGNAFVRIAFSAPAIEGQFAPQYADFCDPSLLDKAANDISWRGLTTAPNRCSLFEWIGDTSGCYLMEEMGRPWTKYADRRLDMAAELGLMRTVVWLRQQPVPRSEWPAVLAQRPAELGLRRVPTISNDGRRISIPLFDQSRYRTFSLKL